VLPDGREPGEPISHRAGAGDARGTLAAAGRRRAANGQIG
jgi:hypothetical protein